MESVEKSIVVSAPVEKVYQGWSRFEEYPRFMKNVREVRAIGENRYLWKAEQGGQEHECTIEMILQIPDQRIAWRSVTGPENSGVVRFTPEAEGQTSIHLEMKYEPDAGWQDSAALAECLESHLKNFKDMVEPGLMARVVEKNWQGF